jgi:hypothetical protein
MKKLLDATLSWGSVERPIDLETKRVNLSSRQNVHIPLPIKNQRFIVVYLYIII